MLPIAVHDEQERLGLHICDHREHVAVAPRFTDDEDFAAVIQQSANRFPKKGVTLDDTDPNDLGTHADLPRLDHRPARIQRSVGPAVKMVLWLRCRWPQT